MKSVVNLERFSQIAYLKLKDLSPTDEKPTDWRKLFQNSGSRSVALYQTLTRREGAKTLILIADLSGG